MSNTLATINTIAGWIPSKIRGVIYALIGLFWLVDDIWHFLPDTDFGAKIASTIKLLALIMAVINTDLVPDPRPPTITDQELEDRRSGDKGESTLMTLVLVVGLIVLLIVLFQLLGR